jgi:hypothetical protein
VFNWISDQLGWAFSRLSDVEERHNWPGSVVAYARSKELQTSFPTNNNRLQRPTLCPSSMRHLPRTRIAHSHFMLSIADEVHHQTSPTYRPLMRSCGYIFIAYCLLIFFDFTPSGPTVAASYRTSGGQVQQTCPDHPIYSPLSLWVGPISRMCLL